MTFTVGQTVLRLPAYNRREKTPKEFTVTRVGRKFVYIEEYGQEIAYNAETGWLRTDYPGSADRIVTPEQYAEQLRFDAAEAKLKGLGLVLGHHHMGYDADVLERVITLLEESNG